MASERLIKPQYEYETFSSFHNSAFFPCFPCRLDSSSVLCVFQPLAVQQWVKWHQPVLLLAADPVTSTKSFAMRSRAIVGTSCMSHLACSSVLSGCDSEMSDETLGCGGAGACSLHIE